MRHFWVLGRMKIRTFKDVWSIVRPHQNPDKINKFSGCLGTFFDEILLQKMWLTLALTGVLIETRSTRSEASSPRAANLQVPESISGEVMLYACNEYRCDTYSRI